MLSLLLLPPSLAPCLRAGCLSVLSARCVRSVSVLNLPQNPRAVMSEPKGAGEWEAMAEL